MTKLKIKTGIGEHRNDIKKAKDATILAKLNNSKMCTF